MGHFETLVDEAAAAPISGWDFSWLDGRATEARPSWHYRDRVAERSAIATAMLELECGDGTLLASLLSLPPLVVATEAYMPNTAIAASRVPHTLAADDAVLPLACRPSPRTRCRHTDHRRQPELIGVSP